MENTKKQQMLEEALISYESGFDGASEEIVSILEKEPENMYEVLGAFSRAWEAVDCDSEGLTHKQDMELDAVLEQYALELIAL